MKMNKPTSKKVLITGSSGFIGSHVFRYFQNAGYEVFGVSRYENNESTIKKDISGNCDWSKELEDVEIVIHCAAAVHQMKASEETLKNYEDLNITATINLAEQAKNSVKRFIFLSTIKVMGEKSSEAKFSADDPTNPQDLYSISKQKAEEGLKKISNSSKMEIVIIRPPMVYGPNPKGNLEKLSNLIKSNIPLPFGLVKSNTRSLLYVENLADFVLLCSEHNAAANETFLISDDEDLSTVDILVNISRALNKKILLLPIPIFLLKTLFFVIGKKDYVNRLMENLSVNVEKNKKLLDWRPKFSVDDGFFRSFKS